MREELATASATRADFLTILYLTLELDGHSAAQALLELGFEDSAPLLRAMQPYGSRRAWSGRPDPVSRMRQIRCERLLTIPECVRSFRRKLLKHPDPRIRKQRMQVTPERLRRWESQPPSPDCNPNIREILSFCYGMPFSELVGGDSGGED